MGEPFVTEALAAARQHALPHELLDAQQVMQRFPGARLASAEVGWLPGTGKIDQDKTTYNPEIKFESKQSKTNMKKKKR